MDNRTGAKAREPHIRSKKRVFLVELPDQVELLTVSGSSESDVEEKIRHQYGVEPILVQAKRLREDNPLVQKPLQHRPFAGLSNLLK